MISLPGRRGFGLSSWAHLHGRFGSHCCGLIHAVPYHLCVGQGNYSPVFCLHLYAQLGQPNTGDPSAGLKLIIAIMMMIILTMLSGHHMDSLLKLSWALTVTLQGRCCCHFIGELVICLPTLLSIACPSLLLLGCLSQTLLPTTFQVASAIRKCCCEIGGERKWASRFSPSPLPCLGQHSFPSCMPCSSVECPSSLAPVSCTSSLLGFPSAGW